MLTIYYVIKTGIEASYTNENNKDERVSFFRHTNHDVFISFIHFSFLFIAVLKIVAKFVYLLLCALF